MSEVLFPGKFKTVKLGEGRNSDYDLFLIKEENGKEKEEKIGTFKGLNNSKNEARNYVLEKDPKATHFRIIHHKPGRERDASQKLPTKIVM